MRIVTIECQVQYSEWQHFTPLGDTHLDSSDSDEMALRRDLKERDGLTGHMILGLGDWGDWVLPDDKRHAAGNLRPKLAAAADTTEAILAYQASFFDKLDSPVKLLLTGNHEATVNKRHHTDVIARLARRLSPKPVTPGVCCWVRMKARGPDNGVCTWYILLHHGAWYGQAAMPHGAVRWATHDMESSWQLFCFGHNHRKASEELAQMAPKHTGDEAIAKNSRIVACGSYLRSYMSKEGGVPGYGEQKGMSPTAIGAPLVRWRMVSRPGSGPSARNKPRREIQLQII